MIRLQSTIFSALVGLLPLATAASQASPIGLDEIRAWIAAHHPSVFQDATLNTVIIVLDSKANYVNSVAARLDSAELATANFRFARVEELIEARQGLRQADTVTSNQCSGRTVGLPDLAPICILDGVRVDSFDALQRLALRDLQVMKGATAVARFGAAAANGVVLGTTVPALVERLKGLGITSANMGSMQTNRVRGGVVGPGPLDIMLLFLKAP